MRANRYLNVILTIIALELGWLAVSHHAAPVSAQPAATRVVITGVDLQPNNAVPVEVLGPVLVEAMRPIPVEAPQPLTVRIPVTTSPVPGQ